MDDVLTWRQGQLTCHCEALDTEPVIRGCRNATWGKAPAYLQKFQKRGLCSACFLEDRHSRAEVVHVLTVRVQHHGLGKLESGEGRGT